MLVEINISLWALNILPDALGLGRSTKLRIIFGHNQNLYNNQKTTTLSKHSSVIPLFESLKKKKKRERAVPQFKEVGREKKYPKNAYIYFAEYKEDYTAMLQMHAYVYRSDLTGHHSHNKI